MRKTKNSQRLFLQAQKVLAGGVNSPVRAYHAVGGTPRFIRSAKGAEIRDADGNRYIDFVGSWGPMILGHGHHKVAAAIKAQAARGTSYGAPTELETEMAELVISAFPSVEKIRFVSSGTEAAMTALRLARAHTGRDKIVKFSGCYHGHSDALLVKAGSGSATLGIPDSAGVTRGVSADTLALPYNDIAAVETLFEDMGESIAAVIVEPVAANMGLVPPKPGFLEGLRSLTSRHGAVLIFDEVITGFRLGFGGAQTVFGIKPDLTCMGKIIGGGLPVGAVGGRRDIMDLLAPLGPVYQAGTLSGNPLAMAAGIATLKELKKTRPYSTLKRRTEKLVAGLPARVSQMGSLFTIFFDDARKYPRFFHALLEEGVYFPPSQFEVCFVSAAHSDAILEKARRAIIKSLERR